MIIETNHNVLFVRILPGTKDDEVILNQLMNELSDRCKDLILNTEDKASNKHDVLEMLNEIAYLFKSVEYQHEHEVRLIVEGTGFEKRISLDTTPPRVYIELISIPSVIKKITLGPKIEWQEEWATAFYYALDMQNYWPQILMSRLPFKSMH